ncbi:hypothetical protein BVRB_2g025970 [Beta vulgaris subsp. vulgaris]|nr:hypothetical protein BVRB_2g025970 [Beta vulgaris subsp. vulgaris]
MWMLHKPLRELAQTRGLSTQDNTRLIPPLQPMTHTF